MCKMVRDLLAALTERDTQLQQVTQERDEARQASTMWFDNLKASEAKLAALRSSLSEAFAAYTGQQGDSPDVP